MFVFPLLTGFLAGIFLLALGFVLGLVAAKAWKRRDQPLLIALDLKTLDQALRLDRALEACEHGTAWVGHDHDKSPHTGVWMWFESDGTFQIRSRYRTRDPSGSGESAAEAIMNFRDSLLAEAADKERRLKEARK